MAKIMVKSTSDVDFNGVKCCVYGGAGVGKTRLCATAPKPIIISAENGLLSLSDENVDYIEISTLEEFDAAYNYVKNSDYETVCLDSLSEIAEVLILEFKPKHKDGRQAYAELADAMLPMLKKFRDLKDKNIIFTCKKIDVKDEDSGVVTTELFLPGNVMPNQVPYLFDELFYMSIDRKGIPWLQTSPTRRIFAKDRSGALSKDGEFATDKDEVPNMTEIFKKIKSKKLANTSKIS